VSLQPTPRLVLLPGMDGTGRLFGPLLRVLPRSPAPVVVAYPSQTVVAFDALIALVESFLPQEEPYVLVAESFSGPLAVGMAARGPVGLKGLVLVASFIRSPARRMVSRVAPLARLLCSVPMPAAVVRRFLVGEDAPAELVSEVVHAIRSVHPSVLASRLQQVLSVNVASQAASCRVPILYIAGTRDRLVRPRSERALRSACPHMGTVVIDAPHLVLQRRPEEAARAIERFLGSL
jgi:pimeloyl-ACP methyl ester carboxylesterase